MKTKTPSLQTKYYRELKKKDPAAYNKTFNSLYLENLQPPCAFTIIKYIEEFGPSSTHELIFLKQLKPSIINIYYDSATSLFTIYRLEKRGILIKEKKINPKSKRMAWIYSINPDIKRNYTYIPTPIKIVHPLY